MKSNLKTGLFLIILCSAFVVNAQFKNGDFKFGSSPNTINDWTNGGAQFVPDEFVKSKDSWIDLTGTGFGNGKYIEQTINTTKDEIYFISFDLGTFFGWDLWDAGVTISLDGKPYGGRIYHSNFTYQQGDNIIQWFRMRSAYIVGTGSPVTVRFTGDSHLVGDQGFNSGVGVIAIDNIAVEKYNAAGFNAHLGLAELSTFPNPANAMLNVQLSNIAVNEFTLVLTDLAGKVVYSENFDNSATGVSISTADLPVGLYYLNLKVGSALIETRKIVVAH